MNTADVVTRYFALRRACPGWIPAYAWAMAMRYPHTYAQVQS